MRRFRCGEMSLRVRRREEGEDGMGWDSVEGVGSKWWRMEAGSEVLALTCIASKRRTG
jgi:hypothetical protein